MAETDRDWLSETIRSVEAIMDRHGFVPDERPEELPVASQINIQRREWIKKLATLLPRGSGKPT